MAKYDFDAPRLFLDAPLRLGARVALDRAQANYLLNVLRLREGGSVLVFNGRDGEWRAEVAPDGRKSADLVTTEQTRPQEAGPDVVYAFAPLKHARLDYMVQKAVEMGASRLQPVITRRTQAQRVNLERMRANAIEAAEQCGILALPEIAAEAPMERVLAELEPDRDLVFCDEEAPVGDPVRALRQGSRNPAAKVAVIVGPEGGFTDEERALALRHPRVVRVSLGPRILRADTAAVAVLALVQTALGDWR
ncbi:16S rRNA (uracil(1498)-N(3))-methyltransferase [Salinarimonas soli]|uniref:Ribosomal RNA small subunit methyltransferase E n=1 Tax=Salinarimonas soli TaxID=1638099 RepID=A0A5B2VTR5_9HYPH|nr:16S rRNA (uracil(1498)-N(3))-methyltransferase [Salinarimonas soli]KAA2242174.1 16S rRNA (uracil(1498)-N(3))-methyltransferase [Salinarimonas soli]